MAVTIASSPQKYTPSDNPIIWTFYSGAIGNPNFSYIIEVYVNAVLISSHQVFPEIGGGYSHFDISEIIRPITPVAIVGSSTIVTDASNYRSAYVKIREFYGTTPGFHADATSATIYPFKACLNPIDFDTFDYTDFKCTSNTKRFLTDSPNTLMLPEGKDYYLNIITDNQTDIGIILTFYDSSNTLITAIDYNAATSFKITQFNLNSDNYLSTLTQPVLDTVSYVDYYIADLGSSPISETKRMYFDRGCDNGAELIWLNKYGAFDVYNYGHNLVASSEITAKTFEKQYGGWVDVNYVLDSSNAGVHSYFKTATDKVKLISKYIDSDTQNWLVRSAYISSLVFMFDATRQMVNIASTSYEESNDRFVEETTEMVDLTLPNIRKSILL
jgi:hypothetical protein